MTVLLAVIVAALLIGCLAWTIAVSLVVGLAASESPRDIEREAREAQRRMWEITRETQAEILRAVIEQRRRPGPRHLP